MPKLKERLKAQDQLILQKVIANQKQSPEYYPFRKAVCLMIPGTKDIITRKRLERFQDKITQVMEAKGEGSFLYYRTKAVYDEETKRLLAKAGHCYYHSFLARLNRKLQARRYTAKHLPDGSLEIRCHFLRTRIQSFSSPIKAPNSRD